MSLYNVRVSELENGVRFISQTLNREGSHRDRANRFLAGVSPQHYDLVLSLVDPNKWNDFVNGRTKCKLSDDEQVYALCLKRKIVQRELRRLIAERNKDPGWGSSHFLDALVKISEWEGLELIYGSYIAIEYTVVTRGRVEIRTRDSWSEFGLYTIDQLKEEHPDDPVYSFVNYVTKESLEQAIIEAVRKRDEQDDRSWFDRIIAEQPRSAYEQIRYLAGQTKSELLVNLLNEQIAIREADEQWNRDYAAQLDPEMVQPLLVMLGHWNPESVLIPLLEARTVQSPPQPPEEPELQCLIC